MKDFEDMQEKYKDKGKIEPKTIPLAADAAHLLSEYLDSITIQLVIAGVDEPYRITQEYEEILVQELQIKGGTSKLTYEVVASVLEQYGTPTQVVQKFITENNPKLIDLIPKVKSKRKRSSSRFREILIKFALGVVFLLSFITFEAFLPNQSVYSESLIIALVIFTGIELYTGIIENPIEGGIYEIFRQLAIFVLTLESLILTWNAFDVGSYYAIFFDFTIISLAWLSMMLIVFIKDHTEFLNTTNLHPKPIARFVLPSYLAFGIAVIMGSLTLILDDNHNSGNGEPLVWYMMAFIFAIASLALEIRRKYPLSLKKLGYTIGLFFVLPIYFFTYYETRYYEFSSDEVFFIKTDSIILSFGIWLTIVAIFIPLIFRTQISEQLQAFRD